jgi:hypothetical protein
MRIIYTTHAKERMKQRKILPRDIREAILHPTSELVRTDGLHMVNKSKGKRVLEIICKKSHTTAVIITAYYL